MDEGTYARPPVVAGMFYPHRASELRETVDSLLANVRPVKAKGELLGIIVPHAGYQYSGFTAAHAYSLLEHRDIGTVVLVGPSHREYFDGISVFSGASFTTPLGAVQVDDEFRSRLQKIIPDVQRSLSGHRAEHSLEVQLPFLQQTAGNFQIVPIVIGNQKREYCEELGSALAEAAHGCNVLLVASSDLSHYYSSDVAQKLDAVAIASIKKIDYDTLMGDLEAERTEACGGGPIVAVLYAAQKMGADECEVLHACNSGEISGDTDRVVGYVSAALWKTH
ncbi:MAG TPA: AmmeMemoRadiSam system protein B [Bacteroidota bacterium]|nr:AmmeMemoRadiSam system protein B [Bacteroidota bacterium]